MTDECWELGSRQVQSGWQGGSEASGSEGSTVWARLEAPGSRLGLPSGDAVGMLQITHQAKE